MENLKMSTSNIGSSPINIRHDNTYSIEICSYIAHVHQSIQFGYLRTLAFGLIQTCLSSQTKSCPTRAQKKLVYTGKMYLGHLHYFVELLLQCREIQSRSASIKIWSSHKMHSKCCDFVIFKKKEISVSSMTERTNIR